MALAQILDLDEARRRRAAASQPATLPMSPSNDVLAAWCYFWMPMYFWYVG